MGSSPSKKKCKAPQQQQPVSYPNNGASGGAQPPHGGGQPPPYAEQKGNEPPPAYDVKPGGQQEQPPAAYQPPPPAGTVQVVHKPVVEDDLDHIVNELIIGKTIGDVFKKGNVLQLISRCSGQSLQILKGASNELFLDAKGGDALQLPNAQWTVERKPSHVVNIHNNYNYIAIVKGLPVIKFHLEGTKPSNDCDLRLQTYDNDFAVFESIKEKGRFLAAEPSGDMKPASAVKKKNEMVAHWGVKLLAVKEKKEIGLFDF